MTAPQPLWYVNVNGAGWCLIRARTAFEAAWFGSWPDMQRRFAVDAPRGTLLLSGTGEHGRFAVYSEQASSIRGYGAPSSLPLGVLDAWLGWEVRE